MLYFLYFLKEQFVILNVFKYITFRAFGAGLTAFLISIFLGSKFIKFLKRKQLKENIRQDGPPTHLSKAGTPTMGGVFIVASIMISTLLWVNLLMEEIWIVLLFTLSFAILGFIDDWSKLSTKKGLTIKTKFLFQFIIGALFITFLVFSQSEGFSMSIRVDEIQNYSFTSITLPFIKQVIINLGYFYIPFGLLVVVGASNAVNLTDGLDGLAIGLIVIASGTYIIFAYLSGNSEFSKYLQIPHVLNAGELAIFLAAVGGACLGFLWYNSHPAQVFMGDVGSLALGAAIGSSALIIKQELLLILVGGIFVAEALSVTLQILSFKLTGKRIFKMAPLHHHFEISGWSESKIVIRFWIICIVLSLISLSSLKLR